MHIYLRKEKLKGEVKLATDSKSSNYYMGEIVFNFDSDTPHISTNRDADVLAEETTLTETFLKATIINFPTYPVKREYGIYEYGKAKAELTYAQNGPYCLKVEVSSFENLKDIETIQFKIAAGRISPTISYEVPQRKNHPLEILRQLFSERRLSSFQRFFLALRLTKQ